jgi:phosphoserine phosphatase
MNVYDFDGTLYDTDCSISFGFWCVNHHPKLWFTYFPGIIKSFVKYKLKMIPNYRLQRELFRYLTLIDDFDEQIERYCDKNEKRIAPWYLAQRKPDDLIISASPICIIEPIAQRLGVRAVGTDYNRTYGVFLDNLMYAKEKVRYFVDHGFPKIDNFYSDSLADTPLALCAEKAYLVTDGASKVVDWPDLDTETKAVVKRKIDTGWNIHLK